MLSLYITFHNFFYLLAHPFFYFYLWKMVFGRFFFFTSCSLSHILCSHSVPPPPLAQIFSVVLCSNWQGGRSRITSSYCAKFLSILCAVEFGIDEFNGIRKFKTCHTLHAVDAAWIQPFLCGIFPPIAVGGLSSWTMC